MKITYKFEHGARRKWVRFNEGKNNLPKDSIVSVKSIKDSLSHQWGVPVEEIKATRMVEDE